MTKLRYHSTTCLAVEDLNILTSYKQQNNTYDYIQNNLSCVNEPQSLEN
ncbi:uncharacterized protein An02g08960 [Aspergillus niger]|uniref:Contig An02c0270, genomic contig n=2 Tax=Aspergillus niger TaxID=5061 RepID=A2QE10_ASPNC|nr:uncharacterized protein An02g08960 [Aspergillus niger]CAK44306.1 unnamed protein product [Aspergillus niger]